MSVLIADFVAGAIDVALAPGDTSMSSTALADLPVVAAPDVAYLSLYRRDGAGRFLAKEWLKVTAHSLGASTATVIRGQRGTGAGTWNAGDRWVHGPGRADFDKDVRIAGPLGAFDDEFDDDVLDAAWIRVDRSGNSAGLVYTEKNGLLSLKHEGTDNSGEFHGLMKPMTGLSAPVTIETCIRVAGHYAINNLMNGLGFASGAVYGSTNLLTNHGYSNSSNGSGLFLANYFVTNWNSAVGLGTDYGQAQFPGVLGIHFRLQWSAANTWNAWWSSDGVSWIQVLTNKAQTMTPTHFGLVHSHYGGNLRTISTFDYFRVS